MDANARTGIRGIGWTDSKVLGAYGRDELNDNGVRLLIHATDNKVALPHTNYATPARGISYTFQSPNRGKVQYRLDYILTRQVGRRLVRNVTVRAPPTENAESDHNLVFGNIRLLGRIAPNRPKRMIKNRRAIGPRASGKKNPGPSPYPPPPLPPPQKSLFSFFFPSN